MCSGENLPIIPRGDLNFKGVVMATIRVDEKDAKRICRFIEDSADARMGDVWRRLNEALQRAERRPKGAKK